MAKAKKGKKLARLRIRMRGNKVIIGLRGNVLSRSSRVRSIFHRKGS